MLCQFLKGEYFDEATLSEPEINEYGGEFDINKDENHTHEEKEREAYSLSCSFSRKLSDVTIMNCQMKGESFTKHKFDIGIRMQELKTNKLYLLL